MSNGYRFPRNQTGKIMSTLKEMEGTYGSMNERKLHHWRCSLSGGSVILCPKTIAWRTRPKSSANSPLREGAGRADVSWYSGGQHDPSLTHHPILGSRSTFLKGRTPEQERHEICNLFLVGSGVSMFVLMLATPASAFCCISPIHKIGK